MELKKAWEPLEAQQFRRGQLSVNLVDSAVWNDFVFDQAELHPPIIPPADH
jgi:hypothetical protein